MSEIKFNKDNFKTEVINHKGIAVVDFWAPWCGPCKVMDQIFEETAKEAKDKAKFGKLNVDEEQEIGAENNILSIPTIIIFKDGKEVARLAGVQDKNSLIKKIDEVST